MRSEKEIRERIELIQKADARDGVATESPFLLNWVLKGPPRYSVEEFEKVQKWYLIQIRTKGTKEYGEWQESEPFTTHQMICNFIKVNPDKVREILAGRKRKAKP